MKKVSFKNYRRLNLVGAFHEPKKQTKSVVIIAHGFLANKDRDRLIKLAEGITLSGIATFRFDFGGCGESEERLITVKDQVDDLKSAIRWLRTQGYTNIGVWGESLGGLTALEAYDPSIKTLVLWAPVTEGSEKTIEGYITQSNEEVIVGKNFVVKKKDGRFFEIAKEYFRERASVRQKELLAPVRCPVLIIHGDHDDRVPYAWSKSAVKQLPKGSKLETIVGAGHKPGAEEVATIVSLSVKWFKKYLS